MAPARAARFGLCLAALLCCGQLRAAEAHDPAAARAEPTLEPGDLVRIRMREDLSIGYEGVISSLGTIPLKHLGEFRTVGMTPTQAETALSQALTRNLYQKATVSVVLVRKVPGKAYVYGAVKKPGQVPMPEVGTLTVLQAISYAEGLTTWARPTDAYIRRQAGDGAPETVPVDLTSIIATGLPGAGNDLALMPNDVLFVPGVSGGAQQLLSSDPLEVIVVGEVNRPGIVLFAPGEQRTMMRAIFKAGGFTKFAKDKAVRLIRYAADGARTVTELDARAVIEDGFLDQDVSMEPGDMLIVPQKLVNF